MVTFKSLYNGVSIKFHKINITIFDQQFLTYKVIYTQDVTQGTHLLLHHHMVNMIALIKLVSYMQAH
jgi:hypothetical protein